MAVTLTNGNDYFLWYDEHENEPGDIYGIAGHDFIDGGFVNDYIDGGDGNDTVRGGGYNGSDTLVGGAGDDVMEGFGGDDELRSGAGRDYLRGDAPRVNGNDDVGNDRLYIEASAADGPDTAIGGAGDDLYVLIGGINVVMPGAAAADEGYDTITSEFSFNFNISIGSWLGIEAIVLNGNLNTNAIGNSRDNDIFGNVGNNLLDGAGGNDYLAGGDGDDTLQGSSGADIMWGEFGNDTYYIDQAADETNESANQGIDTIVSPLDLDLGFRPNIENLILSGSRPIGGFGNDLNNAITGNDAANFFNGGNGVDTLTGGRGDDGYVLGDLNLVRSNNGIIFEAYDFIQEQVGQGIDSVVVGYQPSFFSSEGRRYYILGANVEYGLVSGTQDFNLAGNEHDNRLTGNDAKNLLEGLAGNDTLDGGLAYDTLTGGLGNDTYVLSSAGLRYTADGFPLPAYDKVNEAAGGGVDTVRVSRAASPLGGELISYVLGAEIEVGIVENYGDFDLTGNDFANFLVGNNFANALGGGGAGRDTIDGQAGNDYIDGGPEGDLMIGGRGNDIFLCYQSGDLAREEEGEGTDTVYALFNLTLRANVENLLLLGTANLQGAGNGLANVIHGQGGRNLLSGLDGLDSLRGFEGDDLLRGGLGNDTLSGGTGADRFRFDSAPNGSTNRDSVVDFTVGVDKIELENAIYTTLSAGALPAGAFRVGAARDSNDRILYNSQNGAVLFDPDGTGAQAAIPFAQLSPNLGLTADDFRVV